LLHWKALGIIGIILLVAVVSPPSSSSGVRSLIRVLMNPWDANRQ